MAFLFFSSFSFFLGFIYWAVYFIAFSSSQPHARVGTCLYSRLLILAAGCRWKAARDKMCMRFAKTLLLKASTRVNDGVAIELDRKACNLT